MKRSRDGTASRRSMLVLVAAAAGVAGAAERPTQARADDAKTLAPSAGVTGPTCLIKGTYPAPKGAVIYDAPSGGRAIATFTGALQAMQLSDFPADPTTGRAHIATSVGNPNLRLEGWVAPAAVSVFTTRDVAVSAGHVWISEAQRVKLVQAALGSLTVEIVVAGTNGQTVRATAPCDALALEHGKPAALEVPGNGRGYLTKGGSVELFDAPAGSPIFTLNALEVVQQLFWSTESRAGFVHLRGRGMLTIDAWARASSVEPLKKGEMMDQFVPPTSAVTGAQLVLDKPPRVAQASRAVSLFAHRDDKKTIGTIEQGAEVYVMETMLGWVNVLPKSLGVAPADDGGFWAAAADLP